MAVPTIFIIILNRNNRIVLLMVSSILFIFSYQALGKLDYEALDF